MYVPPELPLSSYAAPPKMNDYLPKAASAYAGATYNPPQPSAAGVPYQGAPAKPRAPLSPQIVDNHSPQPYQQSQPAWRKSQASSVSFEQNQPQQSIYQQQDQDRQQSQQYQQTSSMTTNKSSMYEQSSGSSGATTVKDMRSRFSGPNVQHSQTLPRNFLSAPAQPYTGSAGSPTSDGSKVRNASPLPFGRHATTTNKAHFENSYTKTQFHNSLYQPPKGPLQHSITNSANVANRRQFGRAHEYHAQPQYDSYQQQQSSFNQQQQQPQYQPKYLPQQQQQQQQHNQHQQQQYNEHVSRSQFRSPAQPRHNTAPAPVFRNVTNFCFCR